MGFPAATRTYSLLTEICRERGWCLPPGTDEQVREAMLGGITGVAELLTETEMRFAFVMLNRETQQWLISKIDDWLFDPHGRGAASGLQL